MAISKVIVNGTIMMDVTSDTVENNNLLSGYSAVKADGSGITGAYQLPSGTLSINENGIFNIKSYASASVNAEAIHDFEKEYYERTITPEFPESVMSGVMPSRAFTGCINFISINFPNVTEIGFVAFKGCTSLQTAIFSSAVFLRAQAFDRCYNLENISFPKCISVYGSAFSYCSSLKEVYFPLCESIGWGAFYSCGSLSLVNFPSLYNISAQAFTNCTALNTVVIGLSSGGRCYSAIGGSISTAAFSACTHLLSFYWLWNAPIPNLSSTAVFISTPISNYTASTGGVYGSIFVPSSLYDSFISATNWAAYSARIVSLTDSQIEALRASLFG